MRFLVSIFIGFVLSALAASSSAFSADTPDFLKNRVFFTDVSQCGDTVESKPDVLQLSQEGIFGVEFGCQFLGFVHDKDPESGQIYVSVATANCGDDTGINRPDNITLLNDIENKKIIVQSQNEYNLREVINYTAQANDKPIPDLSNFYVSRTYELCE